MEDAAVSAFDVQLKTLLTPSGAEDSPLARMAAEHFLGGGKRLRARLAWAAGRALGVDESTVLPWAVACEVLHNATLVHDDVQDGDTTRRGQPTVWVRHGVAQAINVGDWLFMRALAAIDAAHALNDRQRVCLWRALRSGLETVIAGQVAECSFRGHAIVSPTAYSDMVRQKTAALFVLPVYGAAIASGAGEAQASALASAFDGLGEMFQWVDDLIDLYGDKGRDAPGQDLYEGKMSGLVVTHVAHHPHAREFLTRVLHSSRETTRAEDVSAARRLFLEGNTLAAIYAHIDAIAQDATQQCEPSLRPVHDALLQAILAPLAALDADAKRALYAA